MSHFDAAAWWAARLSSAGNLLAGRVVLTLGTFDALHVGHMELLAGCRALAGQNGCVVVGVNPDAFVQRFKGRAPLVPFAHRMEMLRACRFADAVVANIGGEDSRPAIEMVEPDIIAIGSDWEDRDYLGQLGVSEPWLDARGIRIEYLPRTRGESTSGIRERARAAPAADLAEIARNAETYRRDILGVRS